jgi:uncharacterized protein YtpQ (UPF0354 family)
MFPTSLKTFVHPGKVYQLEYPAHWDQVQQDEARSCGFGPHDRDDVGLWISILPASVDTDKLAEELPNLMRQALPPTQAGELQRDPTLQHYGLKADMRKEGEGGHYWIVAGGDVVLFASSQVPAAERDVWNPPFEKLMASLRITRDEELLARKLSIELLEELRKRHPDQDYQLDEKGIRGKNRVVYLSNLFREIREAPHRRAHILKHFVDSLDQSAEVEMGYEPWDEARTQLLPLIKPRDYIRPDGPTRHQLITEWLPGVIICYALKVKNLFRFVTGWDVDRWETDAKTVHDLAVENLRRLPWPERLEGARQRDGGRVIVVQTNDSMASSRLLHPELHRLFSGPLGSPFWAGIPDRDTLVVYSDRRQLKQRIARRLRIDYRSSAYSITPRPFLVTADGIAPGPDEERGRKK